MKVLKLFLLTLSVLCLTENSLAQMIKGELEHEGVTRTYSLHIPETNSTSELLPLVIGLHGRFGDGERMAHFTEFNRVANEKNFIIAYPDGQDGEWNYVKDIPGYPTDKADDSSFILALKEHLLASYAIDKQGIYVAGLSNGGFMAQRLACDAANEFTAFATVAAAGFGGMPQVCQNPSPVSMLLMHGTHDTNIPWNGISQENAFGQDVIIAASVLDTMTFWVTYSSCTTEFTEESIPEQGNSPNTKVTILAFNDCQDNKEIVLYAISGGGHNWPGVKGKIPESIAGQVNTDIHASEAIWSFFEKQKAAN